MAEKEGFEPSMGFKAHTPLAGERLRPLGHLSVKYGARGRSRTSDRLVRSQVLYPAELHTLHILHFKFMAEREGFEPSIGFNAYTPLAGARLQPLGHLSILNSFTTFTRAS